MKRIPRARQQAAGFSLIELLIVIAILGILASISTLYLISSRRAANGASAVQSMRLFSSVQASYAAGVGNKEYATPDDLYREELIDSSVAGACNPLPTSQTASGLAAPVALRPKAGFVFDFTVISTVPSPPLPIVSGSAPAYTVMGKPLNATGVNRDGDRTYYVDQTGVIRVSTDPTQAATINSSPLN